MTTHVAVVDWTSPSHRDSRAAPNLDMPMTVGWNAAVQAVTSIDNGRFAEETFPLDVPPPAAS